MGPPERSPGPPMSENKNRRFGLIGTVTRDVITQASVRVQSGLGGILYHGAGLCALEQDVTLFTNVAQDFLPQVRSLVDRWPTFDGTEVETVAGPGNRVLLHYPEEGERVEILATTKEWTKVRWVSPEGNEVIGWILSEFAGRP